MKFCKCYEFCWNLMTVSPITRDLQGKTALKILQSERLVIVVHKRNFILTFREPSINMDTQVRKKIYTIYLYFSECFISIFCIVIVFFHYTVRPSDEILKSHNLKDTGWKQKQTQYTCIFLKVSFLFLYCNCILPLHNTAFRWNTEKPKFERQIAVVHKRNFVLTFREPSINMDTQVKKFFYTIYLYLYFSESFISIFVM